VIERLDLAASGTYDRAYENGRAADAPPARHQGGKP
jgi:hypothetical protein